MEREKQARVRCTESNAADFRQLVSEWPSLAATVASLQKQGLFPGLRGMQITLTGDQQFVDGGVGSLIGENGLLARVARSECAKGGNDGNAV
ncbi:hypothetical protein HNP33_002541 [Comamonas odontotermitis]|uniref:Uncharacterized protein n=1 Tax=Comamonas odontotermitis TaxID=379895 RepID=A0ABR6RH18_9BURK|nr:hypothetical protein [Comamonas odontotermitis]